MRHNFIRKMLYILLYILVIKLPSNQSLCCIKSIFRVCHCLSFGGLSNKSLSFLGNGYYRWSGSNSFRVLNNFRNSSLHYRDTAVSSPQVYTNYVLAFGLGKLSKKPFIQEISYHIITLININ